jgi:hypothetical protein
MPVFLKRLFSLHDHLATATCVFRVKLFIFIQRSSVHLLSIFYLALRHAQNFKSFLQHVQYTSVVFKTKCLTQGQNDSVAEISMIPGSLNT